MNEIKCPKCGTIFQISESDYESIVKQIRDQEFKNEIDLVTKQHEKEKDNAIKLALSDKEKEYSDLVNKKEIEINELKNKLLLKDNEKEIVVIFFITL